MATILKRKGKNGYSYRITVSISSPSGERKRYVKTIHEKQLTEKTAAKMYKEVEQIANEWEHELRHIKDKNTIIRADQTLLSDMYQPWYDWLTDREKAGIVQPRTVRFYAEMYRLYCADFFAGYTLEQVSPDVAQDFVDRLRIQQQYSNATVKHALAAMRSLYYYIVSVKKITSKNPFAGVKIQLDKNEKDTSRALEKQEIDVFLAMLNDDIVPLKWRAFFLIGLTTGIRIEENLALTFGDIDGCNINVDKAVILANDKKQYVRKTKNKYSVRKIKAPKMTIYAIEKWKKELKEHAKKIGDKWLGSDPEDFSEQLIFPATNGKDTTRLNYPSKRLIRFRNQWNEKNKDNPTMKLEHFRPYDLRHTSCTYQIMAGIPLPEIAYNMGHGSLQMISQVYGHIMRNGDDRENVFEDFGLERKSLQDIQADINDETVNEIMEKIRKMDKDQLAEVLVFVRLQEMMA